MPDGALEFEFELDPEHELEAPEEELLPSGEHELLEEGRERVEEALEEPAIVYEFEDGKEITIRTLEDVQTLLEHMAAEDEQLKRDMELIEGIGEFVQKGSNIKSNMQLLQKVQINAGKNRKFVVELTRWLKDINPDPSLLIMLNRFYKKGLIDPVLDGNIEFLIEQVEGQAKLLRQLLSRNGDFYRMLRKYFEYGVNDENILP